MTITSRAATRMGSVFPVKVMTAGWQATEVISRKKPAIGQANAGRPTDRAAMMPASGRPKMMNRAKPLLVATACSRASRSKCVEVGAAGAEAGEAVVGVVIGPFSLGRYRQSARHSAGKHDLPGLGEHRRWSPSARIRGPANDRASSATLGGVAHEAPSLVGLPQILTGLRFKYYVASEAVF
jgi:hypothetical protein